MTGELPAFRSLTDDQRAQIRRGLSAEIGKSGGPTRFRISRGRRTLVVTTFASLAVLALGVGAFAALGLRGSEPPKDIQLEQEWKSELAVGVEENPEKVFANLTPGEFRARLQGAAKTYDFTVVSLTLLQPQGLAPLVVVKTSDRTSFARRLPDILRVIDPRQEGGPSSTGWAFEGFFLKALDKEDQPFVIVHNFWRGDHPGGGEWATSPDLQPFPGGGYFGVETSGQ